MHVSKAWRAAVQRSSASCTDVSCGKLTHTQHLSRTSSFASWLAKNPGLVGTLKVGYQERQDASPEDSAAVLQAAQQLVEFGLQGAAAGTNAHLALRAYTSSMPPTAGLLSALPAATLTSLCLEAAGDGRWFSTLSRLTSLQKLSFSVQNAATDSCLNQIGRLKQLTQLDMHDIVYTGDMQLLPVPLQQLRLEYMDSAFADSILVDLQHLVALQHLELESPQLADGSSVPPNLQSLELYADWPNEGLVGFCDLYQVTAITRRGRDIQGRYLRSLGHLTNLQSLCLTLETEEDLLKGAAAWPKLPLTELQISASMVYSDDWQQKVKAGLHLGMMLFIWSEAMFFVVLLWRFLHAALMPSIQIGMSWPPLGVVPVE